MSSQEHRWLRVLAVLAIVAAQFLPRVVSHVATREAPSPAATLASF